MAERAGDEQVREIIKDAIQYATEAVSADGGRAWVDGVADAVSEIINDLSAAGYDIVKRPVGPEVTVGRART